MIASAASLREREARAQTQPVHTYDVNDGKNDAYDNPLGELGIDLGGHVPWQRYSDATSASPHYYARHFVPPAGGPSSFAAWMYTAAIDLGELNTFLATYCPGAASYDVLPTLANGRVIPDPTMPVNPNHFLAWWGSEVMYWSYKINGGSMMICAKCDPSGANLLLNPNGPSILLYNYYHHPSSFGTNKNRFQTSPTGEWPREFQGNDGTNPFGIFYAEAAWPNVKGPKEQAIEAGDLVVFVQENYSQNLWIGLQRTQEAEWWVRHEFANGPPKPTPPGGNYGSITNLGRSFMHGSSWGQLVAPIYSLLQPKIYSGSTEWIMSDFGYELSDYWDLWRHFAVGLDRLGWARTTDTTYVNFYQLVDLLGIRFDETRFSQPGWDVALFSANFRPGDMKVPVFGVVGDNDLVFSPHWSRGDAPLAGTSPYAAPRYFRNFSHNKSFGYIPSINEYSVYDGTEWQKLQQAAGGPWSNGPLVPATLPTSPNPWKPYPDPYTHTLRHEHVATVNAGLLTELDLHQGMSPSYQKPGLSVNVKTIGIGLYPGMNDSMHVADVDGDGNLEVVFGNFDGFVHVLEFNPGLNSGDPYRLYEEWKSPYLGWGIVGHDMYFAGGFGQMFFTNSEGEIWRINAGPANVYTVQGGAPIAKPATSSPKYLYAGSTPILLVNDIDDINTGKEVLVMNRFFDWAMFKIDGTSLARLGRYLHIVGPTDAFPMQLDLSTTSKEVLVTAADGNVWEIKGPSSTPNGWKDTSVVRALIPAGTSSLSGNLALFKLVPCHFNGTSNPPTHLLLFGRNDDLNDANAGAPTGVIQLWDLRYYPGTPVLVGTTTSPAGIEEGMSFTWLAKPQAGASSASFAIASGGDLLTFDLGFVPPGTLPPPGGPGTLSLLGNLHMFPSKTDDLPTPECITSIDYAPLQLFGAPENGIVLSSSRGRIFVLNTALQFVRRSDQEYASLPTGASSTPWPCNRSITRVYACDLDQPQPGDGSGDLYFAQFDPPLYTTGDPPVPHYRLGKISIGSGGSNAWNPFVQEAVNETTWDSKFPTFNRTLMYRDVDPNVLGKEFRIFAETGTAYLDTSVNPSIVREFQTASLGAISISASGFHGGHQNQGGRIFERKTRTAGDYDYLGGFIVKNDAANPCKDFNSGGEGWWYPSINPAKFLSGQIANPEQSVTQLGLGTSMKTAQLRVDSGESTLPTTHLVVGSNNGFVYAIQPGPRPVMTGCTLSYQSPNLGQYIVGLDVGELDHGTTIDADQEIVCGNWIDTGTFEDWKNGVATRNRAHLYVLDPVPGSTPGANQFSVTELDGDGFCGGSGKGIGSGVTGVKIDDVNGDGTNEIWCSDALGHIYLFRWRVNPSPSKWVCFFRSDDLGSYPGCYNNLFPIKKLDTADNKVKTVKLAVVSPGYVMLFQVNPALLP